MTVLAPQAAPDRLSDIQHAQMEHDLLHLLPAGPIPTTMMALMAHPAAAKLQPDVAQEPLAVQASVKSVLRWRRFPAGGWVYWQTPCRMQRTDQGKDLEVPLGRHIIAPGWGKCIHHLADGAFPNGFGNPYAVVYIGSGRFARRLVYLGHCNADVIPVGWTFHTGRILARPNHSLNSGWGWAEIGWAPNGYPGPMGNGASIARLMTPLWRWSRT